ncbi:hypothetical protein QYM36_014850 [Artemia franciscana]|uniref:Uncharacterized protein n=1 Tax=Artemia franciscana TaxID=6661 RepID=A0AA88HLC2_ARTSF|nr:hypothetical protein QYM36_014850 [Artemia franciscana]
MEQKLRRKVFLAESELEKLGRQEKKTIAQKKEVLAKLKDRSKILQERLLEFKAKEKEHQCCFEPFYEEIANLEESKAHLEKIVKQYAKVKETEAELKKRSELSRIKFIEVKNKSNSWAGEAKYEQQFDQLLNNFNSLRGENLKARTKLEEIILKNYEVKERVISEENQLKNDKKKKEKLIETASSLLVEREENIEKQKIFEERLRIILSKHNKETKEANRKMIEEKTLREYVSVKKKPRGKQHRSENDKEVKTAEVHNDSSKWDEFFKRSEGKSLFQILTLVKSVMNDNVALFQNLGQFNCEIQNQTADSKKFVVKEANQIFLLENISEGIEEHDDLKYLEDVCQLLKIPKSFADGEALVICKIIDKINELITGHL